MGRAHNQVPSHKLGVGPPILRSPPLALILWRPSALPPACPRGAAESSRTFKTGWTSEEAGFKSFAELRPTQDIFETSLYKSAAFLSAHSPHFVLFHSRYHHYLTLFIYGLSLFFSPSFPLSLLSFIPSIHLFFLLFLLLSFSPNFFEMKLL